VKSDRREVSEIPTIRPRRPDSHKGDYGRALIIAGSEGMTGAAGLAATAAMRAGAGLVTLAVPRSVYPIVAGPLSCFITKPLPETTEGTISPEAISVLRPVLQSFDVIGLGPGISRNPNTRHFVLSLMPALERPVVIDADGLNLLAEEVAAIKVLRAEAVITPHPGEAARLLGKTAAAVQSDRLASAFRLKELTGATVVLKGYGTVVADAERYYVNPTGNPGMASGGSGDVLLGVLVALIGQGYKPFQAAQLGVYVHGLAGDIARDAVGEISLTAADILDALPAAFKKVADTGRKARPT